LCCAFAAIETAPAQQAAQTAAEQKRVQDLIAQMSHYQRNLAQLQQQLNQLGTQASQLQVSAQYATLSNAQKATHDSIMAMLKNAK
jgi:prefoldin subunit 5